MPNYCAVKNCNSFSKNKDCENIRFFSFPKETNISKLWLKTTGKTNVNIKYGRICSLHFTDDDWRLRDKMLNIPVKKRLLNPNAVPSQLLPEINDNEDVINKNKKTEKRNTRQMIKSDTKNILPFEYVEVAQNISVEENIREVVNIEENINKKSVEVQTEVEMEFAREFKIMELERQVEAYKKEITKMKEKFIELETLESSVKKIFTSGQVKKLKEPNARINWKLEDISTAISAGPRSYKYLYKNNYPSPGPSTLKNGSKKKM